MSAALGSMVVELALDDGKYIQGMTRAEFAAQKAAKAAENESRRIERAAKQSQAAIASMADKTALSSKQITAAMRGVPAQFTDIVVSLQGGQNPLTVFLQQGGQLKDMFGGAGNAARALGTYVAGLVNPFSLTVAGAGLLLYSLQNAASEATELRKSLVLTGNASGASFDELVGYSEKISVAFGVTQGAATEAISTIVGTGAVARTNLEDFTRIALEAESVLGVSVGDIAKNMQKLGQSPVSAAFELNKSLGFLTESTFKQIIAAEKLGNKEQAAALAQVAYAKALDARAKEVKGSFGYIETAFSSVAKTAKEAWDSILGIGREDSLDKQIEKAEKRISSAQALADKARQRGQTLPNTPVAGGAQSDLDNLRETQRLQRRASDRIAESNAQAKKKIEDDFKAFNAPKKADAKDTALADFERATEANRKELQGLQELSKEQKFLEDVTAGRYKNQTAAQIESLRLQEREIDKAISMKAINKELADAQVQQAEREKRDAEDQLRSEEQLKKATEDRVKSLYAATPSAKFKEYIKDIELLQADLKDTTRTQEEYNEAVATLANGYGNLSENIKETKSLTEELGLSFTSAFEDAIVGGGAFSDVLKGLEKDIARLIVRKQVTDPLAKAVQGFDFGGLLKGFDLGKLFGGGDIAPGLAGSAGPLRSWSGGGYTGDGARSGGLDGQGGYLAMIHPQESIIDHAKGQGMGGTSINQSITIDARGADAGVTERIMQAMRQTKAETLAAVQSQANRGGSFARAVGRA